MGEFPELDQLVSVDELRARRDELEAEMTRMDSDAGVKPFTGEQRGTFELLKSERDEADTRLREIEARTSIIGAFAQRDEAAEKPVFHTSRASTPKGDSIYDLSGIRALGDDQQKSELRDRALRSVDQSTFSDSDAATNVARLLNENDPEGIVARRILTTGSPAYKRAFGKYLAQKPRTVEEERALTTAANYAVPYTVDPTVTLTSNGQINPVRQIANVITITGNHWTGVASAGVSAAYAAESTEVTDGSPTLTQPAADVEKAQGFIQYPLEVGEDWGALQAEMSRMFADAKDALESSKFLTGLGHASNQPEGLLVGATGTVLTAGASVMAVADIYSLMAALAPRWRARGTFVGSLAAYQKVRQFDTQGGASLWVQLQFDEPANLVGRPAFEWSDYSSAITTGGSSVLTFGDFNQFTIVDRVGMNVEVVPHMLGSNRLPNGNRGLYMYWRNTSDVRVAAAFKTLKITA